MKHNWKLSCNCVRVCLYNECRWDILISRMCEIHLVGDVNINKNNASSGGDASSSSASTPPPKTHNHPPTHILHTPQIWSSNAMQSHNHMNRLMYDSKTHGTVPPSTSITHGADLVPDVKRVNGNKGLLLTLLFGFCTAVFCPSDAALSPDVGDEWVTRADVWDQNTSSLPLQWISQNLAAACHKHLLRYSL